MRIPRHSLEHIMFPLSTTPTDPSTLTHEVAVVPVTAQPAEPDWHPADYDGGNVLLLVRASTDAPAGGTVTLSPGRWSVWWRAQSTPEYPARLVGEFAVF